MDPEFSRQEQITFEGEEVDEVPGLAEHPPAVRILKIGLAEVGVGGSGGGSGYEETIEDFKPDHLGIPLQPAEVAVGLLYFLLVDQEEADSLFGSYVEPVVHRHQGVDAETSKLEETADRRSRLRVGNGSAPAGRCRTRYVHGRPPSPRVDCCPGAR